MLLLNIFVTPFYLVYIGVPSKDVADAQVMDLLPKVLLPFNFAKALMNSAVAMLLYKPISKALKKTGLSVSKSTDANDAFKFNKNTVVILSVGIVALAAAIAIILFIS
jgi:hypothetical protein